MGVMPVAKRANGFKGAKVQPVEHMVLEERAGEPGWAGVITGKGCTAVGGINSWDVTAEQPQTVREHRPANLVSGLDNLASIFLGDVVLGGAVFTLSSRKTRQRGVDTQTANRAAPRGGTK